MTSYTTYYPAFHEDALRSIAYREGLLWNEGEPKLTADEILDMAEDMLHVYLPEQGSDSELERIRILVREEYRKGIKVRD